MRRIAPSMDRPEEAIDPLMMGRRAPSALVSALGPGLQGAPARTGPFYRRRKEGAILEAFLQKSINYI